MTTPEEQIASLAKIILHHRKRSKLTQGELAKLAGVSKGVVFEIEQGKHCTVQLDTLLKILTTLNITMTFTSPIMTKIGDTTP